MTLVYGRAGLEPTERMAPRTPPGWSLQHAEQLVRNYKDRKLERSCLPESVRTDSGWN
jgi:hypothetical protein